METAPLRLLEKLFGKPLLRILGIFTTPVKKEKIHASKKGIKKILVIRTGGLGDGILAVPFLKELKDSFEGCHITLICIKRNKVVFTNLPYLEEMVVVDDLRYLWPNLKHIFASIYDALFDLEPIYRLSTVLSFLIKAKVKVGFDTGGRRDFYTRFVNYNQADYEADNFLRQLEVFDIKAEPAKEKLNYPIRKEYLLKAGELLKNKGINGQKDFLIALSLGTLNEQNRWPVQKFSELIKKILEFREAFKIILIGGREDLPENRKLMQGIESRHYKGRVIDFAGKTDFHTSFAILKHCNLFIGYDAGPLHMAVFAGLPTISFFGSAVESRWNPGGNCHIGLNKNYPCSPCKRGRFSMMPNCPYQYACIRGITTEETFRAFKSLYKSNSGIRP